MKSTSESSVDCSGRAAEDRPAQPRMTTTDRRPEVRASDAVLVELLRTRGKTGVGDLASALRVTATAVRQRLERLMREGIVTRHVVLNPLAEGAAGSRRRGRPAHVYSLTDKGVRTGGDNFRDLAMVLWSEIRRVESPEVRRGLLSRIGTAMAGLYDEQVSVGPIAERLERMAGVFRDREITCGVEFTSPSEGGPLAVLTNHVCPYPEIAEQDRGICAAERLMLQELLGTSVALTSCRLDGSECCRFSIGTGSEAVEDAGEG